jgi:hypothetical protein
MNGSESHLSLFVDLRAFALGAFTSCPSGSGLILLTASRAFAGEHRRHFRHIPLSTTTGTPYNFLIPEVQSKFSWIEHMQTLRNSETPIEEGMLIGGKHIDSADKIEILNPARPDDLVGTIVRGTTDHVDAAVRSAKSVQPTWAATHGPPGIVVRDRNNAFDFGACRTWALDRRSRRPVWEGNRFRR